MSTNHTDNHTKDFLRFLIYPPIVLLVLSLVLSAIFSMFVGQIVMYAGLVYIFGLALLRIGAKQRESNYRNDHPSDYHKGKRS